MTTRLLLPTILLGLMLGACPSDENDPEPYDPVITELAVRPATPAVAVGRQIHLSAEAKTADGLAYDQNQVVTWTVDDPTLLQVDTVGIAKGLAAGDAVVTATHPDGPVAEVTVHVLASDVVSVRIEPALPALAAGETVQLTATAVLENETEEDVTASANWACNNLAAASVGNEEAAKGLVTGVEAGQATVAATYLGIRGGTTVTVSIPEEDAE